MTKELSRIRKEDNNYKRFKENRLFFRTRGLDKLQERFDEDIAGHIKNLSENQKEVRILEIGFGEGKALLEAIGLGTNIYGYGVNDKKRITLSSPKDIITNSKKFNIEIYHTPKIYFYDAGSGLKFKDNYFDVIFSQVAIHYIGDKARLIEDVWRVLKKDGRAFLNIDGGLRGAQPDFMYLHKDSPRFVVYSRNKKIISTKRLFDKYRKKGYDMKFNVRKDEKLNITLVMHKNNYKKLDLGLDYDGNSTIYLTPLKESDKYKFDTGIWWGTRSVYNLKR
jgi:SAM-dependent methyltransferase